MESKIRQPSLFDDVIEAIPTGVETVPDTSVIKGFGYIPEFLDHEAHDALLRMVDEQTWLDDLKRRVQHYGYKYDYKARHVDYSMRIGALPDWAADLAERLHEEGLAPDLPDQLIVNEYEPGQGISNHIDCQPCFTDTIISISLGSTCVMNFTHVATKKVIPVFLEPRSLVLLQGESRHDWQHGIPGRLKDKHQGATIQRKRRVSLTFRKVVLD
jgi:alkylated DNA repair dioxygenase AlkB